MCIVQRHGRIDRIGFKHDYVNYGLFFRAERLGALLELESRLEAKIPLADAAVGAGEGLAGRSPGHEVHLLLAGRIWNYRATDCSTLQYAMFTVMRDIRGLGLEDFGTTLRSGASHR